MDRQDALVMLQQFILELNADGIESEADYRTWAKDQEELLCELFDYEPEDGMPKMADLMTPHFHPELPLVGLNYTPLAHNLLYKHPVGWTTQLRMCRGIVFDRYADLVSLCLLKFFNAGENDETKILPACPVEVLDKLDGDSGQIFYYEKEFHVKTQGSFTHRTAVLADRMLQPLVERRNWQVLDVGHLSIVTEVIHQETHVICKYGRQRHLKLIAAFDNRTLEDFTHEKLVALGEKLGLRVVKRWIFQTSKDVLAAVRDPNVKNREGFVVRYKDGSRVKFKYHAYLGEMIRERFSYAYIMRRWMDGRLEAVMKKLPEELIPEAVRIIAQLEEVLAMEGTQKDRWRYLYTLLPADQATPNAKTVCREFVKNY